MAHVKAAEEKAAGGNRFFLVAGKYSNKELGQVIRKNFPDLASKAPTEQTPGGDFPQGGVFGFDNSKSKKVLGIEYNSFEKAITDTVNSLKDINA